MAISTVKNIWARIWSWVLAIWHLIVGVDAEVKSVEANHPEVVAAVEAAIKVAPPQVQAGVAVAVEAAHAVDATISNVEHVTPPSA